MTANPNTNSGPNPNPQGKGLVPVLDQLSIATTHSAKAKGPAQILGDYLASSLVLSARFAFKPVRGVRYSLYRKTDHWQLSLVSPDDWKIDQTTNMSQTIDVEFTGYCELLPDLTWSLDLREDLTGHTHITEAIRLHCEHFVSTIDESVSLESSLPFYKANLPFYARVFAHALSKSLADSITHSGLTDQKGQQWLAGKTISLLQ